MSIEIALNMSSGSRSRSPMDRKIRTIRHSYRDEPYRRDRRGFRLFRFQSFISCSFCPFDYSLQRYASWEAK